MGFEDNLKKLEELVSKMESGSLKLDEMIQAFEEGRKLVDVCQKDLESIRLRMDMLRSAGNSVTFMTLERGRKHAEDRPKSA